MTAALHVIAEPGPGRLATIAHPRDAPWPAEQLAALAGAGVDVIVSALTTAEQQRLGIGDIAVAGKAVGVEFVSFPAEEGGNPRAEAAAMVALAAWMAANVRAGRFVVSQTSDGIGRVTLLACSTLVLLGIAPGDALRRITAGAEDEPVPQDWLHDLATQSAG